jgi:amidase|tara:strand:- start:2386 stop:3837 length:1452 start_codon:yes stop_codon:yes gene_type:complete
MTTAFKSAIELAQMIKDKRMSSREMTEYFIGRIEKYDGDVNAVVVRDFERALQAADAADAALAKGDDLGPLHGLPMTIKESYNIAGLKTHWGYPRFKDNVVDSDADTVTKMKEAGALFMGKTNVPVGLADFQSYNEIYGTTGNPWDTSRTPGGSSGGSAAALAAGFTGLEAGSDIGGSIRNPAHYCGVFGHKPTYGIVPFKGHDLPGMLREPDVAVVGPLARSADDLRLSMDIVAGPNPLNKPGWTLTLPRPTKTKLSEYKVAIWPNHELCPITQETSDRVANIADVLAKAGATVSDVARPDIDIEKAYRLYLNLLSSAMSAGVPDDQIKAAQEYVASLQEMDQSDSAVSSRGSVQIHGDWIRNAGRREVLRLAWREFFEDWDILICPQQPTPAFPHDHSPQEERVLMVDNQEIPYMRQVFWAGIIILAQLPSTVFPTGPSSEGLPIGLQAVSGEFNDYVCIDFVRLLSQEIGGFMPPPGYDD